MSFFARDRFGATFSNPSIQKLEELLASLDPNDREHPDVSLTSRNGACPTFQAACLFGRMSLMENRDI
jgi:hypothetical protein